jgi:hypothetical protein
LGLVTAEEGAAIRQEEQRCYARSQLKHRCLIERLERALTFAGKPLLERFYAAKAASLLVLFCSA